MPRRLPSLKVVLIALVPCMLALGIWLGGHPRWLPEPIADVLVGPEDRRVALQALDIIHDKYYDALGRGELADAAISGAIDKLDDRFSAYFSPTEYGAFKQAINNQFTGIGTTITRVKRGLRVESVYDGSPAKKAGIRVGDVITRADGKSLAGRPETAATALVKGPDGTTVKLTVRRGERTLKLTVKRALIAVPVVQSRIERAGGKRVGYVRLTTFGPRAAHAQVSEAIRKAKAKKAKGIVLDLRDNGGGLVSEAQLVASMFLADGPIVTTRGRAVRERTLEAVGQPIAGKLPTVVLVNGGTASASEIVAGALQDRKRAKLVGVDTFGKGVFQEILPLDNGGALDITVGQYFLPSGRNLGGKGTKTGSGLKPDVRAIDDADTKADEALDRALEVLAPQL